MSAVLGVAMVACAVLGTTTVLTRDPLRQAMVAGFFGLALIAVFALLQAPDDSLSAIVVAAAASPLLTLLALARIRASRPDESARSDDGSGS